MGIGHDTWKYEFSNRLAMMAVEAFECAEESEAQVLMARAGMLLESCVDVYWNTPTEKSTVLRAMRQAETSDNLRVWKRAALVLEEHQ